MIFLRSKSDPPPFRRPLPPPCPHPLPHSMAREDHVVLVALDDKGRNTEHAPAQPPLPAINSPPSGAGHVSRHQDHGP